MKQIRSINTQFSPLSLAIIMLIGAQFGFYLYTPALPKIANYFHVNDVSIQMTLSVFILGYGISQFLSGMLADFYRLRTLVVFYSAIYLISSFFCYRAPNYLIFLIMRGAEGLAAGGMSTLARVTIKASYEESKLLKNMSVYSMASVFAPAVSPFIGGQLTHYFKWQAIFFLISMYVFFLMVLLVNLFPKDNLHTVKEKISLKLIFNNCITVISNSEFIRFSTINILIYFACALELAFAPFIIINQYGLSGATYGIVMMFPALGYFLGSFLLRTMSRYIDQDYLISLGLVIIFISGIVLLAANFSILPVSLIITCLTMTTIGAGFIFSPVAIKAYSLSFGRNVQGTTIAIFGSMQMLGGSLLLSFASILNVSRINIFVYAYILIPLMIFVLRWIRFVPKMEMIKRKRLIEEKN